MRSSWHERRMMWWQWRTTFKLSLPWVQKKWARVFYTDPELHNARHYADNPELGHSQMAYETMAGLYNDRTPGGFMTYQQARNLYEGYTNDARREAGNQAGSRTEQLAADCAHES